MTDKAAGLENARLEIDEQNRKNTSFSSPAFSVNPPKQKCFQFP